jgi:uncharacterized membrane protein
MTLPPLSILAQASSMSAMRMVLALSAVVVIAGVLLALLGVVRRRIREETAFVPKDFALSDLRDLHRDGKLTDEEFERAKAKLVSGVQAKLAKEAKPSRLEQPLQEELKDA